MFQIIFPLLFFLISPTLEVNLSSRVRILNGENYYAKVLQETFYEIEDRGFCNLKLVDFNQTLNESLYNWHVLGTVYYSNGFVVSIERIALLSLRSATSHSQAGVTTATFSANINMFNVRVGYDVTAVLDKEGTHKFTGIFTHSAIQQTIFLSKNLATGEMTADPTTNSVAGGSGVRMVYMPESTISEVLSRRVPAPVYAENTTIEVIDHYEYLDRVEFLASSTFNNLRSWTNDIIIPILLKKAKEVEFPNYCVHC